MVRQQIVRVRRLVTFHLVALAFLTAALVAPANAQLSSQASGSVFLPLLVLVVGVSSLLFVDMLEWFSLHHVLAYVFMVIGTFLALFDYFWGSGKESASGQLYAIASLLIYPQIVIMLQRKNMRLFEQMAIFLLIEIIVAALVNDNVLFGVLLAPIVVFWVSSLLLLTRYTALIQLAPHLDKPTPRLIEFLIAVWRRARAGTALPPPMLKVVQPENAQRGQVSVLTLTGQSVPIGVAAIAFAVAYFYLLPRATQETIVPLAATTRTGFAETLSLGGISKMLKDDTTVMRVSLKDAESGKAYRLDEPPYIRGTVVSRYLRTIGRTSFEVYDEGRRPSEKQRLSTSRSILTGSDGDPVVAHFEILEPDGSILPSFAPMVNDDSTKNFVQLLPFEWRAINARAESFSGRNKPSYRLFTTAFRDGLELPLVPDSRELFNKPGRNDGEQYLSRLISLSGMNEAAFLPEWTSAFWQDVAQRFPSSKLPIARAQAAEQYLANSGNFTYSLVQPPLTDPDLDPIADFIVNKKRGSCQSFAAALTVALRQQRIPTRIVLGYHPLEFNEIGGYFTVRNRDAHAWVEAYFQPEQLKAEGLYKEHFGQHGAWLRLDPTPPGEGSNAGSELRSQEPPSAIADYAEQLWNDLFLNSRHRAEEHSLYGPLKESTLATYRQFVEALKEAVRRLRNSQFAGGAIGADMVALWPLLLLAALCGGFMFLLWRFIRGLPRWAPQLAKKFGLRSGQDDISQQFYRQCLKLLRQLGLQRRLNQTPREYTDQSAQTLAMQRGWDEAPATLDLLTSTYYRMRFGGIRTLDADESRKIAEALLQLEQGLKHSGVVSPLTPQK